MGFENLFSSRRLRFVIALLGGGENGICKHMEDLLCPENCGGFLHGGGHGFEATREADPWFLPTGFFQPPAVENLLKLEVILFGSEVREPSDLGDGECNMWGVESEPVGDEFERERGDGRGG